MSRGTVNKTILLGRVGKDPEMRYAPSGTAIADITIATNHNKKNAAGEWEQQTEWHSIKAFGKTAEFVGEYIKKGGLVYVEGRLQTSSWDDKNTGQKRYRTEVIANELQMVGPKPEQIAGAAPQVQQAPPVASQAQQVPPVAPQAQQVPPVAPQAQQVPPVASQVQQAPVIDVSDDDLPF